MLAGVGARMHARLHDALADGLRVAEAREVPDGIKIHGLFNAFPSCFF